MHHLMQISCVCAKIFVIRCNANSGWKPPELFQDGRARLETRRSRKSKSFARQSERQNPAFDGECESKLLTWKHATLFLQPTADFQIMFPMWLLLSGADSWKTSPLTKLRETCAFLFFSFFFIFFFLPSNNFVPWMVGIRKEEREAAEICEAPRCLLMCEQIEAQGGSGYPTVAAHTTELPPAKAAAGTLAHSQRTIPRIEVTETLIRHCLIIASAYFYPHLQKHHLFFPLHSFPSCTFIAQYQIWTQRLWN